MVLISDTTNFDQTKSCTSVYSMSQKQITNKRLETREVEKTKHSATITTIATMPRPVDSDAVKLYAEAFKAEPKLASVGFSFLCDITNKLFKSKRVSLKDINGNTEAFCYQNKMFLNILGIVRT